MHDMQENVRQSNLQTIYLKKKRVNSTQECVLFFSIWIYYQSLQN